MLYVCCAIMDYCKCSNVVISSVMIYAMLLYIIGLNQLYVHIGNEQLLQVHPRQRQTMSCTT